MNDLRARVNWKEVKQKMKEKYPALTDEDFNEEDEQKLLSHLQQKLGKSKQEIRTIIKKI